MKRRLILTAMITLGLAGCNQCQQSMKTTPQFAPLKASEPQAAMPEDMGVKSGSGKVLETMNSGGYTYANVDMGGTKLWLAGQETSVAVGDTVSFSGGMPMANFRSKTLDRTFDVVYFVSAIQSGDTPTPAASAPAAASGEKAPHMGAPAPVTEKVEGIKKAPGGKTIAEIFAQRADLKGKEITVRGKVVKYNAGIMNRNWVHIQDGTGASGTNDLTVTTNDTAALGKTVLVQGKIATDQDFGGGYKYSVVVEEAKITTE